MSDNNTKIGLTALRIPLLILVALLVLLGIGIIVYSRG